LYSAPALLLKAVRHHPRRGRSRRPAEAHAHQTELVAPFELLYAQGGSMPQELAYLNGTFCPLDDATVSINDRGFLFGDGVYEVLMVYDGRIFQPHGHLERLKNSTSGIDIDFDFHRHDLVSLMQEGLKRSGLNDAMIYIQITRGAAPRNHVYEETLEPTLLLTFRASPRFPEDKRQDGVAVMTTREIRWAHCYIKAITLLPNVLVRNRALRDGFHDALFVTEAGEVRESTAANLFVVRDGRVRMPPRNEAVLHGITQSVIIECAGRVGIPIDEEPIDLDFLRLADEVFLSSTTIEVLGVTSVDRQPIGNGKVGPITRKLHEAFCQFVREETSACSTPC
jgi:D-alanine transaminase